MEKHFNSKQVSVSRPQVSNLSPFAREAKAVAMSYQKNCKLSKQAGRRFKVTKQVIYWSLTMFLTQRLAWPWGSMNSGHLLELKTSTAFSVDKTSRGKPSICQRRIVTGSPRVDMGVQFGVWGTPTALTTPRQSSSRERRYLSVNGPMYATHPTQHL